MGSGLVALPARWFRGRVESGTALPALGQGLRWLCAAGTGLGYRRKHRRAVRQRRFLRASVVQRHNESNRGCPNPLVRGCPRPIGNSAWDLAVCLDITAAFDREDPYTGPAQESRPKPCTQFLQPDRFSGLHVGVVRELFFRHETKREFAIVEAFDKAITKFSSLGATVLLTPLPHPSPCTFDMSKHDAYIVNEMMREEENLSRIAMNLND